MKDIFSSFSEIFEGEFHFDTLHKRLYATDASVYRKIPEAVAFPKNINAIKQLIKFASENKISLVPRTAGTSLAGQCVGNGIIVDVSKYMVDILELDEVNKTVRVQPGVIRDELNAYLQPYGLFFGPNTSTSNRCMIGGMVGNNSSGTTSIQYGVTRDKVLELTTVLSNGEEVTFSNLSNQEFQKKRNLHSLEGKIYQTIYTELASEEVQEQIRREFPKPEIHRRNTGYAIDALIETTVFNPEVTTPINLCKLLTGSEGTLAFTTAIVLQLDDLPPPSSAMIVAQYSTLKNCLNDINEVMKHDLYTCEMMDDVILNCTKKSKKYDSYRFFVQGEPKALLMLEVRASTDQYLELKLAKLQEGLKRTQLSDSAPVLKGDEIKMALDLRKAGLGLLGNMVGDAKAVACIEDTAVALEDLPNYIKEFTALMENYKQEAVYYAHAGAGELHLRPILNLKTEEGVAYFRKITTDVAKLVKKYKGSFSGEHGDGIVRAEFLELQIGTENFKLLKRIKKAFDPTNIFNPGKITDAWPMDQSLRTNPGERQPEIKTLMDFSGSEGILKLAEQCNGSGDCRKTAEMPGAMCPSYHATKNEKDTTRGRANILREVLLSSDQINKFNSSDLKEAFDLCIGCKACGNECPSNVDMATAKAEFLYQYQAANGVSMSTTLLGKSSKYNKLASKFPSLANYIFKAKWTSKLVKNFSGIAHQRELPYISSKSFSKIHQKSINKEFKNKIGYKNVLLFVDEFSNYLESDIAKDCYDLLVGLGYSVTVIDCLDSARALISKGFLLEAKEIVNKNISYLKDSVSENSPLIGIEPSAILGFRDEYLRLADDRLSSKKISENTYLIEEFLSAEIGKDRVTSAQFTSEEKRIKIHIHCHQKSLSNQKVTFDILNLPKNYTPTIITSGCCGMAGSFGYEKDHYHLSMEIGELKLFPAVRKASAETIIAANGTSCRHQINDGTQRKALHPVSILRNALLSNKEI